MWAFCSHLPGLWWRLYNVIMWKLLQGIKSLRGVVISEKSRCGRTTLSLKVLGEHTSLCLHALVVSGTLGLLICHPRRCFCFSTGISPLVQVSFSSSIYYLCICVYIHTYTYMYLSISLFRATPTAHGSSPARGWTKAVAAGLHHSHSNEGSKTRLWPIPQLTAMPDPERGRGSNPCPHGHWLGSLPLSQDGNSFLILFLLFKFFIRV